MKILLTSDTHHAFTANSTVKINRKFWQKVAEQDFDVMVHTGDWCTTNAEVQMRKAIKQCRNYIDKPILTVLGNHDYWSKNHIDPRSMINYHEKVFEEFDIVYLDRETIQINDILFYGYDSWYHVPNPPSNDYYWMPRIVETLPINHYMSKRMDASFERVMDDIEKDESGLKKICVTHMSPYLRKNWFMDRVHIGLSGNPKHLPFITKHCEALLIGHTHRELDEVVDGCRIVEAGSDYNNPKFKILEV